MLVHLWSSQLNEAMNNSVQSVAPTTKNFSGTISLKTRIGIASGILAIGHSELWTRVFLKLDLDMDSIFTSSLLVCDKNKNKKRKR